MLFAIVIVSIISVITIGLSNTTYKELILSSTATDSQNAFYQADTADECALYADNVLGLFSGSNGTTLIYCGINVSNGANYELDASSSGSVFNLNPPSVLANGTTPCFLINVVKSGTAPYTTIKGLGYNICNQSSIRAVERAIQVTY